VLAVLQRLEGEVAGMDVFDLNGLRAHVARTVAGMAPSTSAGAELAPGSQAGKAAAAAYSAFEVAFLDLQARAQGVPLVDLLGGALRQEVPFSAYLFFKYASMGLPTPDAWAVDEAQIVEQAQRMIGQHGFGSIKLKAGTLEPEHEVACLKALRKAFPKSPLRIDPNGNWSLATALRMAALLEGVLEYYEDPTPGLEGMAELPATGPAATNMVVTDFDEFRRNRPGADCSTTITTGAARATRSCSRACAPASAWACRCTRTRTSASACWRWRTSPQACRTSPMPATRTTPGRRKRTRCSGAARSRSATGAWRSAARPATADPERLARQRLFHACRIRQRDDVRQMFHRPTGKEAASEPG
jgi:hypothetical protein